MKVAEYIHGEHSVHDIKYHIVWITKYRYKILTVKVAQRVRELLIQGCRASMIQEYIEKQFENGDKNHFKVES